ncbi:hypothetical protein MNBD_GAMMA13-221 [hydrothermal vent metagenome]|uniref:Uncharacterized protein n=1 Tax=hydrothermal vent metagenome TaxID=652676 RepID=A0A3B0YDL1_9ZZZZ
MNVRNFILKPVTAILTIASSALLIVACLDGSGGNNSGSSGGSAYAGPGSRWDVALAGDGAFSITKRETATTPVVMTVTGTSVELPSGFIKLTVGNVTADASVTDAPSAGDAAYALNVPGYVFFLKPLDSTDDQVIPMVASGSCPSSNFAANWVNVNVEDDVSANNPLESMYGTFNFDVATGTPTLPSTYSLTQSSLGADNLAGGSCADGILILNNDQGDSETEVYLANNGGAIVRTGIDTPDETDDTYIFGLAQETIADIANVADEYAGLLFDASQLAGDQISPVSVSCNAAGACTGTIVDDIDTNTLSTETVTISLTTVDNPEVGFITGTISVPAGAGTVEGALTCMANINAQGTGKNIMSCVGQSPDDNTELFNILLVSK